MEIIQFSANIAAIVGVPIAIIGLILTYFTLHAKIKQFEIKIDTFNEIINLQNKYNSQGDQYHSCTININSKEPDQINQEFMDG